MAAIINADDGVISGASGLKLSSDTSGALNIQTNGVTAIAISASQAVSFPATTSLNFTSANITTLTSSSATITNLLATSLTVSSGSTLNGGVVINELGADADTRIEGDTDANLVFVDASTDRVGVGTNTPSAKFNISGTSNAYGLRLTGTHAAGDTAISIAPASAITGSYSSIYSDPSASTGVSYTFGNSNSSSSSAHSRVDVLVGGANGGDPKITYTVSGIINWCIGVDNSDSDSFKITTSDSPGTSDRFTIATNGVVGSYATSGTGAQFSLYSNGQTTVPVTLAQGFATATDNIGYLYNRANADFVFGTNNTERARITSGGDFGIGTSSPGLRLTVSETAAKNTANFLNDSWDWYPLQVHNTDTTNNNLLVQFVTDAASGRGSITYNRGTGQVAYNTTSDVRLKENIEDSADAGDKIDAMKVRQFDWKETGNHLDYGFIAQELDAIAPHAVSKPAKEDDFWSVDYSKLVPMLVKEIQSLRSRVAALEAK